jgi:IS5 family transposase
LVRINALIDWNTIERVLGKHYRKTASADGRPAYPALPMFKLLLLQKCYGLSDPGFEEAVNDRISFIRFAGFSVSSTLPDHSTICRFRNALLELNLFENLFAKINRQLEETGILVKESNGAIVDATIIESSRRPRKVIEVMAEDRKEDTEEIPPAITYSGDPDATWVKKGRNPTTGIRSISLLIRTTALSWVVMLLLPMWPIHPSLTDSSKKQILPRIPWWLLTKATAA